MNYAEIKNYDIANGPGVRVSLFVSGCRRGCKGCFNQEAQAFDYGKKYTLKTRMELLGMLKNEHIAGLSVLGGDPFEPENRKTVFNLCKAAKIAFPEKDIWMWTGFLWDDVKDLPVLKFVDVLVDGPFILNKKNLSLPYCGSSNQRVIDVQKSLMHGEVIIL